MYITHGTREGRKRRRRVDKRERRRWDEKKGRKTR
jgi:hypothetical protein